MTYFLHIQSFREQKFLALAGLRRESVVGLIILSHFCTIFMIFVHKKRYPLWLGMEPSAYRPDIHLTRAYRAILVIDVVESVRLIAEDEIASIARWLAFVEEVETEVLPLHGGRLVKSLGDGLLLDFADVRSAATSAFEIQSIIKRRCSDLPKERQILLRMGVEISDVVVDAHDVYGHGVNLAARLMNLAGPGEIVVSANARDQLTPLLDADVEDLGECYLKHVEKPVRAYRIGRPGAVQMIKPDQLSNELRASIAVIPFDAHGNGGEHRFVGEIFAEDVIRSLSRSPNLTVISRLSTTTFRGRRVTLEEINTHLSTNYILSGAYTVSGESIILNVELAETKNGHIVWTDRLRGKVSDLLSEGQELVGRIVHEVGSSILSNELKRVQTQPMPTLESYSLLLGAIALMHRNSRDDFNRAYEMLSTVAERAPRQSLPQAWIANWFVLRLQQGWSDDRKKDSYNAIECSKRSLDADPESPFALAVDGLVHTHMIKRHDVARDRYDIALEKSPSDALAWLWRGTLHAFMGDGDAAVHDTQRALSLSPLDPHRYYFESLAGTAYLTARDYERALETAKNSLRVNRMHTSTLRVLCIAQWQLGQAEEARKTAKELLRLEPNLTISEYLRRSPAAPYETGKEWSNALVSAGIPK